MRRGFTLIELLVTIAIIGVLLGALAPALGGATRAARSAACLSNLRQSHLACRAYADAHRGAGPAIGWPYTRLPNWALVVMDIAGERRTGATDPFENADGATPPSVLVCPEIARAYDQTMTRTYAMNATGHAGAPGDPDTYDAPPPGSTADDSGAHIRFDLVQRPSLTPLLMDAAIASFPSNAPPPTRTASVIDFRQPAHVSARLGLFHDGRCAFHVVFLDGAAAARRSADPMWLEPLP